MCEQGVGLNTMKGTVVVVVHVKELKGHSNVFVVKLPFRPNRGDWINLEGQKLQWEGIDTPKLIPEVAKEAGLRVCSAIHVEEIVILCHVEQEECEVHVYGHTGLDPLHLGL